MSLGEVNQALHEAGGDYAEISADYMMGGANYHDMVNGLNGSSQSVDKAVGAAGSVAGHVLSANESLRTVFEELDVAGSITAHVHEMLNEGRSKDADSANNLTRIAESVLPQTETTRNAEIIDWREQVAVAPVRADSATALAKIACDATDVHLVNKHHVRIQRILHLLQEVYEETKELQNELGATQQEQSKAVAATKQVETASTDMGSSIGRLAQMTHHVAGLV